MEKKDGGRISTRGRWNDCSYIYSMLGTPYSVAPATCFILVEESRCRDIKQNESSVRGVCLFTDEGWNASDVFSFNLLMLTLKCSKSDDPMTIRKLIRNSGLFLIISVIPDGFVRNQRRHSNFLFGLSLFTVRNSKHEKTDNVHKPINSECHKPASEPFQSL
jgi:hypothetical protein